METEILKIQDIKRAEYNPRQISQWALDALKKSMMKFGDLSGVVVNVKTGNLVGGHQRIKHFDPSWKINKQLIMKDEVGTVAEGSIETPFGRWSYREVDWDETKEKAANIAANHHGGEWDIVKLKKINRELFDAQGQLLMFTGQNDLELQNNLGEATFKKPETRLDADEKLEIYKNAEIKQIVLFFLGEEFNDIIARLSELCKDFGVKDNTSVFLKLLEHYEKTRAKEARN